MDTCQQTVARESAVKSPFLMVYLLPTFSIAIQSLEIEIFTLSGNKDYAEETATACFHMHFCPCRSHSQPRAVHRDRESVNFVCLCPPPLLHMLKRCFKTVFKLSMQHTYFSR